MNMNNMKKNKHIRCKGLRMLERKRTENINHRKNKNKKQTINREVKEVVLDSLIHRKEIMVC